MKKLILAFACMGFFAFAATAQTTQTGNAKAETTAKTTESHSGKGCCAADKNKKACKDGEEKGSCKGHSKKECKHDESGMKGEEKSTSEKAGSSK